MSMSDLERAVALIEENAGEADFEGPKPEELIQRAENTLGLAFPLTYREFLSRLGCGNIAGEEFYGLIKNDFERSGVPDAIWLSLKHRRTSQLPQSLVIVASTGNGHYYAIDMSQKSDEGESPVVEWVPGMSKPTDNLPVVADDFGAFLLGRLTEALEKSGQRGHS